MVKKFTELTNRSWNRVQITDPKFASTKRNSALAWAIKISASISPWIHLQLAWPCFQKAKNKAVEFSSPAGNEACLLELNTLVLPKDPPQYPLLLHIDKNIFPKNWASEAYLNCIHIYNRFCCITDFFKKVSIHSVSINITYLRAKHETEEFYSTALHVHQDLPLICWP